MYESFSHGHSDVNSENFSSAPFFDEVHGREGGGEESEEFFGIYRFVAHEHSVAELIFHIIKGGEGLIDV